MIHIRKYSIIVWRPFGAPNPKAYKCDLRPHRVRVFFLIDFSLREPVSPPGSMQSLNKHIRDFGRRFRDSQARPDLNALSLRTSFHSIRRCHTSFQRKKVTNSFMQLWCLWILSVTHIAWWPHRCSSPVHTMAVTSSFLIGPTHHAQWKRQHA